MKVVNLFAGPGVGKTTTMCGIVHRLKSLGLNADPVPEYAKELVWDGIDPTNVWQPKIFGIQANRVETLRDKVNYAIVDSPLLLSCIYGKDVKFSSFHQFVIDCHSSYDNINFLLTREGIYNTTGRVHNKEQSVEIQNKIINLLDSINEPYITVDICNKKALNYIISKILE